MPSEFQQTPDNDLISPGEETEEVIASLEDGDGTYPQIEALAKLKAEDPIQYDQQVKTVAAELGAKKATIEAEVEKLRGGTGVRSDGDAIFDIHDPWPAPVDGKELVDDIEDVISRIVVTQRACDPLTLALWAMFTHVFEEFEFSPRLNLTSPEKRCGKSTVLDLLELLVARGVVVSNSSSAAIFRTIHNHKATICFDEVDTFLKADPELVGILNNGHKKNGRVLRCEGENNEGKVYRVWSPIAIAARQRPNLRALHEEAHRRRLRSLPIDGRFHTRPLSWPDGRARDGGLAETGPRDGKKRRRFASRLGQAHGDIPAGPAGAGRRFWDRGRRVQFPTPN